MRSTEALKREIAYYARLAYERDLVHAISGNISARLGKGMAITPRLTPFRSLKPNQIVIVDGPGRVRGGEPSVEFPLHRMIYDHFPDVHAVIHTHSAYATMWATLGTALKPSNLEGKFFLNEVPITETGESGTEAMALDVCQTLRGHKAVLIRDHGTVAVGHDLEEAYNLAELLEETAKMESLKRLLGRA